ncbi:XrtA-associated tyrosine autokinase [Thalassotalea mangrovi]|nr:XrtA-associated tyrosine autokinase [Thalassotalea mangrovi]
MSTIEQALAKKQADLASKAKQEGVDADSSTEQNITQKNVQSSADSNADTGSVVEKAAQAQPEHVAGEVNESLSVKDNDVSEMESITARRDDEDDSVLQLDLEMLENLGFLTSQDSSRNHGIQEEFREIKRNLLGNALTSKANNVKHPNLVMVSSALADEGKTFIAINLALSIAAEQDKTVLLVDADIYKPSVLRHCGIKPRKGLIEYLLGNVKQPGDIIYSTNVAKLKIMPTGTPHYLANELLASAKMTALVEELASRYPDRIVIFDCPPILGLTETAALSQLMGQAIIAVEENKTSIQKVNRACAMLNEDLAKGLVLNKALQSHKELYGNNSYGYDNKTIQ